MTKFPGADRFNLTKKERLVAGLSLFIPSATPQGLQPPKSALTHLLPNRLAFPALEHYRSPLRLCLSALASRLLKGIWMPISLNPASRREQCATLSDSIGIKR